MNPEQAVALLDKMVSAMQLNRQDHVNAQAAVIVLREFIKKNVVEVPALQTGPPVGAQDSVPKKEKQA